MITDNEFPIGLRRQLEEVMTDNYEKLYSCTYRMVGNHQDTEDVLQNSFLKAYQNLDKFKGLAKMSTWVYRIVVNESYRFFEYSKKLPLIRITESSGINEDEFFKDIDYTPNLEDSLIVEEMREKCLQGFLKCLPRNQRVCFLLKSDLNLSHKDISEVLNTSVENVKVLLFRGRKRLKEMFEFRCSLIDPDKPCKCYLWIKYMRDHNLPLPEGHAQMKTEDLKREHFRKLSILQKIDYLRHLFSRKVTRF